MLDRARVCLPLLAFVFAVAIAPGAAAQSAPEPSERERALQQDLDAALERIAELTKQVEELQAQLAAAGLAGDNGTQPTDTASPAGAVWKCSDDAVAEARRRYAAKFEAKPIPQDTKSPEFTLAMRGLESWATVQSRDLRQPIEWTVRCQGTAGEDPSAGVAKLIVVDPASGADVGFPFTVTLDRHAQRLLEDTPDATFVLQGMLLPRLHVVLERPEAGPFQERPFIGPYCELTFRITPKVFFRKEKPKPAEPAAGG